MPAISACVEITAAMGTTLSAADRFGDDHLALAPGALHYTPRSALLRTDSKRLIADK